MLFNDSQRGGACMGRGGVTICLLWLGQGQGYRYRLGQAQVRVTIRLGLQLGLGYVRHYFIGLTQVRVRVRVWLGYRQGLGQGYIAVTVRVMLYQAQVKGWVRVRLGFCYHQVMVRLGLGLHYLPYHTQSSTSLQDNTKISRGNT